MRDILEEKCNLFLKNREAMKKIFKWEYSASHSMGALLYCSRNKQIEVDKLKEYKELVKEKTGMFSRFRGNATPAITTILSLSDNPEELLEKAIKTYDLLKKSGFSSSDYLVIATLMFVENVEEKDYEKVINRARSLYDEMKRIHPFITSHDDYGLTLMLAITDKDVNQAIKEMEQCYNRLRSSLSGKNSLQSLSHILTMSDALVEEKCSRVTDIFEKLKEKGYRFSSSNGEQAVLGLLALLEYDLDEMVNDISDVDSLLRKQRGLGNIAIGKSQRLMYASSLVAYEYVNEVQNKALNITIGNVLTNVIIATETAIIISCVAAAASN
ncbi:MAG: DUF4003 family protein [Clostridiaceae bacterium]|nr:DUF4003 family protein [Clostridiaceae bacterium]